MLWRYQSKKTPSRTHLQPSYEEDELEDKNDGEEHLSIVCVQFLASNQREPKVEVGCHNYNLDVQKKRLKNEFCLF